MRCILVRHPLLAVAPGTCYGRLDFPWSPEGERQVAHIIRSLPVTTRVLTSPALRCRRLAALLGPAVTDDRLLELDFGAWEGRRWDDIPRPEFDAWAADPARTAPPGGETGAALLARTLAVAHALRTANEDTIVILHGGPMKLLRAALVGETPDLLSIAPPPGTVLQLEVTSTAVSATAAAAPNTSPV